MKSLSFVLVTVVACGGTQGSVTEPVAPVAGLATAARPTASGDVSFEVPVTEIKGVVYEPTALDRPGMPLVDPKRPIPLDKQRALVQSTKDPVQKQAQAAVLATMLYRESKNNKPKEKELLTDARQVLRDVAQQAGDKAVDEITLRLLGSYELILEDYPAAEKAWTALIDRDAKAKETKETPYNRAWLAYAQLKQFKTADALATVSTEKLDDKQPELAYFTAWAKLRSGDGAGAWQAITVAARGWGTSPKRDELERDVLLFAARASITADQAASMLTTTLVPPTTSPPKVKTQLQYELLAKLGLSGYGTAGRWADGVAALTKATALAGDTVPLNDWPVIRYQQADFTIRLDAPDVTAKYGKQAIESFGPCGAKCTEHDKADIVQGMYLTGRLFHTLYATANDKRYYQPAHDLYALTIPLLADAATKTQAESDAKKLETTLKNIKPGSGTHDRGALGALLVRHNAEVQACYENALGNSPKLGGTITLNLESDATGVVKGASTEPAEGKDGLAAVAGCVRDHARQWKLPKRGMPGTTRIKASYSLSVKK